MKKFKMLLAGLMTLMVMLFTGCEDKEKEDKQLRKEIMECLNNYNYSLLEGGEATIGELLRDLDIGASWYIKKGANRKAIPDIDIIVLEYIANNYYPKLQDVPVDIRYALALNFTNNGKEIAFPGNIEWILSEKNITKYNIIEDNDGKVLITDLYEDKTYRKDGKSKLNGRYYKTYIVADGIYADITIPIKVSEDYVNKTKTCKVDLRNTHSLIVSYPEGPLYGNKNSYIWSELSGELMIVGGALRKNIFTLIPKGEDVWNKEHPMTVDDMYTFYGVTRNGKDLFIK